jgi:hypothetical protein
MNETLATEWKRREEEREKSVQAKFKEISDLAQELRKKMSSLEERERNVIMRENMIAAKELKTSTDSSVLLEKTFQVS